MKPFDQQLYDRDDPAKHLVLAWCQAKMPECWINPDEYGIDIITTRGNIEVGVKHSWKGARFPFPTVQIPIRKRHLCKPGEQMWFAIVNHDLTHHMFISGATAWESPVIEHTHNGVTELFMDIRKHSRIYKLTDLGDTVQDTLGKARALRKGP